MLDDRDNKESSTSYSCWAGREQKKRGIDPSSNCWVRGRQMQQRKRSFQLLLEKGEDIDNRGSGPFQRIFFAGGRQRQQRKLSFQLLLGRGSIDTIVDKAILAFDGPGEDRETGNAVRPAFLEPGKD